MCHVPVTLFPIISSWFLNIGETLSQCNIAYIYRKISNYHDLESDRNFPGKVSSDTFLGLYVPCACNDPGLPLGGDRAN